LESSAEGIRAVKLSLVGLGTTAVAQAVIVVLVRLTSGHRVKVPAVGPIRWSKTGRTPTTEDTEKLTARVTEHLSATVSVG
jgi:hypothetical protein